MIFRSKHSIGRVNRIPSKSVGAAYQSSKIRRQKVSGILKKLFFFGFFVSFIGSLLLTIVVFQLLQKLPDVDSISTYIPSETTKIYSHDNIVLAELHQEENRILIPLEKISPILKKAVVAVEDTDYYKHHGLNFRGIMRALYVDIKARRFVEGGSTLTQQLARNLFLTKRKKIIRKLEEAILAVQIERKYTKDEILEMYLNQVYWGHNAYGIESASRLYFGKTSAVINLAESAMLVGLLTGPELYSPRKNMSRAKRRQKTVLNRMARVKLITAEEAQAAYSEEIIIAERRSFKYKAPFFTSHIIKQLIEMYGEEATYTSGMKVYTTLDYRLQEIAEKTVKKYVEKADKSYWIKGQKVSSLNVNQGAILAIDPRTGYIKAMQGGTDFRRNEFNRCTQAKRQPGSSFKPFVYLTALEKGLSPGTFIEDSSVTFNTVEGPYSPRNYTKKFLGNIPLRKALEKSVNVVAIKLNDLVGPTNVARVAEQLGIQSKLLPVLSLPLGSSEVTMLELASVYGVFANQGRRVESVSIRHIEDRDGNPLYEAEIFEKKVFDSNLIAALVEMLRGVVNYGTGRNARLPRPVGGKTGTTSDYKDAWFVGFVPQMVCAAWLGNDDNSPMINMTGGWFPAMMWKEFMKEALKNVSPQDFQRARGLRKVKVNWTTGNLASEYSDSNKITYEKYWRGTEPKKKDTRQTISRMRRKQKNTDTDVLNFFAN